jgi:prolyl oligopeptidase
MHIRPICLLLASTLLVTASGFAAEPVATVRPKSDVPPKARKVDVVDHDFGLSMPDPYRWMEGEDNAEFNAWLHAQGAAGRIQLDALPTLQDWRSRLSATYRSSTNHNHHTLVGERLFFLRASAGKEAILLVREADGRDHVLFDPNAITGGASIGGFSVSPDGRKVAVNIGFGGNEIGEIALFDTASGKRLADTLKPVWSEFQAKWLPDGRGFFYTRMHDGKPDAADPMQAMTTYLHRLGQPQNTDQLRARAGADDALKIASNDFPIIMAPAGSRFAELVIGGARASFRGCYALLADAVAGNTAWRCLFDDADNVQASALHGDTLYLLSAKDAPNRRILALNLRDPKATLANARVVVPERTDVVLSEFGVAHDALYVKSMRHGIDGVERIDYASGERIPIALPTEGTISLLATNPRQTGAMLVLEGWTTPSKAYRYDTKHLLDTGLGAIGMPEYPDLLVEEIEATSADGTHVPLSVIHRRDLKRDGHARAIVNGYGGYGASMSSNFSPQFLEWPQAGNVYAVCHVRGGGENGDAWRTGGTGPNKPRGIEDFIACAKELAARGYSTPARTGGISGSMGGILTGGAYTTAPEAWGAMGVQSGVFNAVRLLAAKNGANQVAEMGDPRTEAGMQQLLVMDPYQHVRAGVQYPPLLLVTGAVDQRVPPWNSGKFGARVLDASPSTPVWFRTDDQFGHFATNANAAALELADLYAFFDAMLQTH